MWTYVDKLHSQGHECPRRVVVVLVLVLVLVVVVVVL